MEGESESKEIRSRILYAKDYRLNHTRKLRFSFHSLVSTLKKCDLILLFYFSVSIKLYLFQMVLNLNELYECMQFGNFTLVQLLVMLYSCTSGEKLQNYSTDVTNSV